MKKPDGIDGLLLLSLLLAAVFGFSFASDPYQLATIGKPVDQEALIHRDSQYSHITWVISESSNYAELRFYDKVEGGVCLYPTWADMQGLAPGGELDHIAMPANANIAGAPAGSTWPAGKAKPNPGTLTKSAYVNMFSAGLLLNDRLMAEANGDPRQAKANILVVGLGSGVGISVLAHHFPEASIAVVDIDQVVIEMVLNHYPFIAWLSQQTTSDGRPRLKMGDAEAIDARQYIRHGYLRNDNDRKYDMVIVDAFTDGSTIPPHLMTKEFFEEIRACMYEDGIVLSNVIGSYTGPKYKVVGGSLLAQREAGLNHTYNLPLMHGAIEFNPKTSRNNIIIASTQALDPQGNRAGWERLRNWIPYPELPTRRYVSREIALLDDRGKFISAMAPLPDGDDYASLRSGLRRLIRDQITSNKANRWGTTETPELVKSAKEMVLTYYPQAPGWKAPANSLVYYQETDWVMQARENWSTTIREAVRTEMPGRRQIHDGELLVGSDGTGGIIPDVPLFTDNRPNADLFNR